MNKFKLGKDALILTILTLITVLTWIAFDVYRTLTRTEIPQVLQRQIAPLNPKLSQVTVLNKLKTNISFTEEELNEISTFVPEEESTESAEKTKAEKTTTESGSLD